MKQFFYAILSSCLFVSFSIAGISVTAQDLLIDFSAAVVEVAPGGGGVIVIDDIPYAGPEPGQGLDISGVEVQSNISGGIEVVLPNTPVTYNSNGDAVIDYRDLPLVLGGNTLPEGPQAVQAGTGGGGVIVIDDIPYEVISAGPVFLKLTGVEAYSTGGGGVIVIDDIPYSIQTPHLYWFGEYAELSVGGAEFLVGPNPVNQGQEIQVSSAATIQRIRVTNQQGVIVQEQMINQAEGYVFTEELTPGYYWIYIDEGQGFTAPSLIAVQ